MENIEDATKTNKVAVNILSRAGKLCFMKRFLIRKNKSINGDNFYARKFATIDCEVMLVENGLIFNWLCCYGSFLSV